VRALAACLGVALVLALGANASSRRSSAVFRVDRKQAAQVGVIVEFVRAWNTRQLSKALALLAPVASFSDCDYRTHRAVVLGRKAQIAAWLRKRFEDRDVLTIGRVFNENPDQTRVSGIDWERRTSKLFPTGTAPKVSAKVIFDRKGRILAFANGPGGAPPDQQVRICSP